MDMMWKPEPKLSDARHLLKFRWNQPDADFLNPWLRQGDSALFMSRCGWAMAVVADVVALSRQRPANVLVPEYYCDQALFQLRSRGHHLAFYPVDQSARPDWGQIEPFESKTDVFILPHFFGHANDAASARAFCDRSGALLIEDCAQAICAAPGIGEFGDFVIYSPWKIFPIPNGCVLVIRPDANVSAKKVEDCLNKLGQAYPLGLGWLKQAVNANARRILNSPSSLPYGDFYADAATVPMPKRPRAAPYVVPLLAAFDVTDAAERRRNNDAAIRAFFSGFPGWKPWFPASAPGPFKSLFRLENQDQLLAACHALRNVGVAAEGWPGLPPEVDKKTSVAGALRATILHLPCHQGLTPDRITKALKLVEPTLSPRH